MLCCLFFFFKQKTAYEMRISDWSSDVCSSDLLVDRVPDHFVGAVAGQAAEAVIDFKVAAAVAFGDGDSVRTGVESLGEFLLAGLEGRFGALLLGNIPQGGDDAGLVADIDLTTGNHACQRLEIGRASWRERGGQSV